MYCLHLPVGESMYLVILTEKGDVTAYMETLKLIRDLISVLSYSLNEEDICKSTFQLKLAFEEVVSSRGNIHDVNMLQVITNLDACLEIFVSHMLKTQLKVKAAMKIRSSQRMEPLKAKDREDNKKVVFAVAVLTKSGKVLVSRERADMTEDVMKRLMAKFLCKLKEAEEHNYVQTEDKYCLHLPVGESMYVVILTNKGDIAAYRETLKLLHELVCALSYKLDEEGVRESAFQLRFVFEEVVSRKGYTHDVVFGHVITNLDLCVEILLSHLLTTQMKVTQTKDAMQVKAKEIEDVKKVIQADVVLCPKGNNHNVNLDYVIDKLETQLKVKSKDVNLD